MEIIKKIEELTSFKIDVKIDHTAVKTSEEHEKILKGKYDEKENGVVLTKTILVKSKKKKELYLIVVEAGKARVDLKAVKKLVKSGGDLRFNNSALGDLGVEQGSVTPLAVVNDKTNKVYVVLPKDLEGKTLLVHPLVNTVTIGISFDALKTFVEKVGNQVKVIDLKEKPQNNDSNNGGKKQKKQQKKQKKQKKHEFKDGENTDGMVHKKKENFSGWYKDVVTKAELISYYAVSGCYILRPRSFFIWEQVTKFIDTAIKSYGVKNAYFPLFVTEDLLTRETNHIEGFAPEVAWVTKSGKSELDRPLAIRPTSETVIYDSYSKWIRSHRDLPMKLNQWCNVVRWEFSDATPFIRSREFLWQEGHSAFATKKEADFEVRQILDLYSSTYQDILAVPVIQGKKTEKEKFAGADYTTTIEAFIPEVGRGVQAATSHGLGQNFAKMFKVSFLDHDKKKKFVWQNSWGFTTRSIGVMVMSHSDDSGLVLPPKCAPVQVIIVPIIKTGDSTVDKKGEELYNTLKEAGIRVEYDNDQSKKPGFKYNYYEIRGIPLRIDLGKRDIDKNQCVIVRRDLKEAKESDKESVSLDNIAQTVKDRLETMQKAMLNKKKAEMDKCIIQAHSRKEMNEILNKKCICKCLHCADRECEEKIKEATADDAKGLDLELSGAAKSLCIPFNSDPVPEGAKCFFCNEKAVNFTLFGRSY